MSTSQTSGPNIDSILTEKRSFPPPAEFSKNAIIHSKEEYDKICARAAADPEAFWADLFFATKSEYPPIRYEGRRYATRSAHRVLPSENARLTHSISCRVAR